MSTTTTEETTAYTVSLRVSMAPPDLSVDTDLLLYAQSFAKSIVAQALEALPEYDYIDGPVRVRSIDTKLTRFCASTLPELATGNEPESFCGIMDSQVTVQGPPSDIVPFVIADAVRNYTDNRKSIIDVVHVSYRDPGLSMTNLGWGIYSSSSSQESDVLSLGSKRVFESTVVEFLNESNPNILVSDVLVYDQELGTPGDLSKLTIKALVIGDTNFFSRRTFLTDLVSTFQDDPQDFLKRFALENGNSDVANGIKVFAAQAPELMATAAPSASPAAMFQRVEPLEVPRDTSDVKIFVAASVLFVVFLLSCTAACALRSKRQRKAQETQAAASPPETAPPV